MKLTKTKTLFPFFLTAVAAFGQAQVVPRRMIDVLPAAVDTRPQQGFILRDVVVGQPIFNDNVGNNAAFGAVNGDLMRPFNIGIATQLSVLPVASPASGVVFREDPATGAALPSSASLGPILTERAETIGKRRFYMGFTRQQFRFNKLEGNNLHSFRALDRGGSPTNVVQGTARQLTSPTTMDMNVDLKLDQNVAFFTYGLTSRLDASLGLTWVNSTVSAVASNAEIHNVGDPGAAGGTCWCAQTYNVNQSRDTFGTDFGRSGFKLNGPFGSARMTSTGIGDTLVRVKGTVLERPSAAFALGLDLRLPSGKAEDYHGSGSTGVKPFAALSLNSKQVGAVQIAPHFNIGYQFNGKSILAGDITTGTKGDLPNAFNWSAGVGITASRRVTFLADILGLTLLDSFRLRQDSVPGRGQGATTATGIGLATDKQNIQMNSGAFGVKIKLGGNLVFSTNVLVAFDSNGLRDRAVPLFGLGYTF